MDKILLIISSLEKVARYATLVKTAASALYELYDSIASGKVDAKDDKVQAQVASYKEIISSAPPGLEDMSILPLVEAAPIGAMRAMNYDEATKLITYLVSVIDDLFGPSASQILIEALRSEVRDSLGLYKMQLPVKTTERLFSIVGVICNKVRSKNDYDALMHLFMTMASLMKHRMQKGEDMSKLTALDIRELRSAAHKPTELYDTVGTAIEVPDYVEKYIADFEANLLPSADIEKPISTPYDLRGKTATFVDSPNFSTMWTFVERTLIDPI